MNSNRSVDFFDRQFERQIQQAEAALNPFEQAALPHLRGRVLDFGCGMGNLALAAARAGCTVLALDASEVAIAHLQAAANAEGLAVQAQVADLAHDRVNGEFDSIVSIGLLMFLDCASAHRALDDLQAHLVPGGTLVVNVLVEGTTFMDMFDPVQHCLFPRDFLQTRLAGWEVLASSHEDFAAPGNTVKSFATIVARKP
ncbi:methyltransferase domain-containing protein [Hydrogenophaga sp.]|uniref:methyltransferase domain-containing protein n=1 Tax=Hydrogenophaga sp. TaxID=1904254 RepID=UPI00272F12E9|nr:methyltransferase domain-containing protein [Hydrogenophaga sp.]MDP1684048.1 methyltransferase domain-containing protein [Hydrogenophaga sp.]MDP3348678.1 methyltransferase domain-containing protein [Hydrogenophaga sp.]MDZ4396669.1 methyltransferase domain-containing protein [Hydrogenophaga sp.]